MTSFLYFNQHFRSRTKEPKVVVQLGERLVYGNMLEIIHQGVVVARIRTGKLDAPVHDVRGWVETECEVRVT